MTPPPAAWLPSSGLGFANPFPNNMIPANRIDPVAAETDPAVPGRDQL